MSEESSTRPRGRLRRVLLIGLLVAGVGAVGALGTGFVLYDKATQVDRTYPRVVVDEYVDALLVRRDASRASLFTCDSPTDLTPLTELLVWIKEREEKFDVSIQVLIVTSQEA